MGFKSPICQVIVVFFCFYYLKAQGALEDPPSDYTFEVFEMEFGKKYRGAQARESHRRAFIRRLSEVRMMNKQRSEGEAEYGINEYSDMTSEEQEAFYSLKDLNLTASEQIPPIPQVSELPPAFSYIDYGEVTPVKNQGICGSSWAFAAAATYESMLARDTGVHYNISEEYFLWCSSKDYGCSGGWGSSAMELASKTGTPLEASYPYKMNQFAYEDLCTAEVTHLSLTTNTTPIETVTYDRRANPMSADQIKSILYNNGTIMATVRSQSAPFRNYKSGVINCSLYQGDLDHQVQLIGWTENAWIIKNSWGSSWGENGFGRISMNQDEDCELSAYMEIAYVGFPPKKVNNYDSNSNQADQEGKSATNGENITDTTKQTLNQERMNSQDRVQDEEEIYNVSTYRKKAIIIAVAILSFLLLSFIVLSMCLYVKFQEKKSSEKQAEENSNEEGDKGKQLEPVSVEYSQPTIMSTAKTLEDDR